MEKTKLIPVLALVAIVVVAGCTGKGNEQGRLYGPLHWHVQLELETCGVAQGLPSFDPNRQEFYGTPHLHHHNDNKIHLEVPPGESILNSDATLGGFFRAINMPFSSETFMNYKNGDKCSNGAAGMVHFFVNGVENSEFGAHPIIDGERAKIVFG